MIAQTFELATSDATSDDSRGSGRVAHLVTLRHPRTEDEVAIAVYTATEAFTEVLREVAHQRVMQGLLGYQVFEALLISDPF